MRKSFIAVAIVAVVAIGASAWLAAGARGEEGEGGKSALQKSIANAPFTKALLGSWTGASKGSMSEGSGTIVFALGAGDTALLETYANTTKTGEQVLALRGHGVYKLSDDGKVCTCWWFDNTLAEPLRLTGPCDANGCTLTGDTPLGPMEVKMVKVGDAWERHLAAGGHEFMVETIKPAR